MEKVLFSRLRCIAKHQAVDLGGLVREYECVFFQKFSLNTEHKCIFLDEARVRRHRPTVTNAMLRSLNPYRCDARGLLRVLTGKRQSTQFHRYE